MAGRDGLLWPGSGGVDDAGRMQRGTLVVREEGEWTAGAGGDVGEANGCPCEPVVALRQLELGKSSPSSASRLPSPESVALWAACLRARSHSTQRICICICIHCNIHIQLACAVISAAL